MLFVFPNAQRYEKERKTENSKRKTFIVEIKKRKLAVVREFSEFNEFNELIAPTPNIPNIPNIPNLP